MKVFELYTDLNEIPLSRFIAVYNGDVKALVVSGGPDNETLFETAERLIHEYAQIVGGSDISASLSRRNELVSISAEIGILNICTELAKLERWSDVADRLGDLGHRLNPDNHDAIDLKVKSILATKKFQYDRLKRDIESGQKDKKKDPDYFIKEMALVMTHFKMQIDKTKITAKEYAYIVKRMSDEVRAARRSSEKRK